MSGMIILVGPSGAGKTTLAQALYGEALAYRKTQTIEIRSQLIDTPGEFLERRQMNRNLLVSSYDADLVVLAEPADGEQMFFPPGFSAMFAAPVVGVVTKSDAADGERAAFRLRYAGAAQIFHVSALTGDGLPALAEYLRAYGYQGPLASASGR